MASTSNDEEMMMDVKRVKKVKREGKTEHKWERGYFHVAIGKGAPPMVCYTQSYTHPFFTAIPFDIFTIFIICGITSARSLKNEKHILGTSAIVNDVIR